jgi:hypothetical protein
MPLGNIRISSMRDADDRSDRFDRYARQPAPRRWATGRCCRSGWAIMRFSSSSLHKENNAAMAATASCTKHCLRPPCMYRYDRDCWQRAPGPYQAAIHQAIALLLLRSYYHQKAAIHKGISSACRSYYHQNHHYHRSFALSTL